MFAANMIIGFVIGDIGGRVASELTKTKIITMSKTLTQAQVEIKTVTITVTVTEVTTVTSTLHLKRGKWNTIIEFMGSASKTTELFYIPSDTWRIN